MCFWANATERNKRRELSGGAVVEEYRVGRDGLKGKGIQEDGEAVV